MRRLTNGKMDNLIERLSFEPLNIEILEKQYKIGSNSSERIDLLLNINWENTSEEFITEVKKQGTPTAGHRDRRLPFRFSPHL